MASQIEIQFKPVDRNPKHTRVSVYAGERNCTPGLCGTLTFANEEWDALERALPFQSRSWIRLIRSQPSNNEGGSG